MKIKLSKTKWEEMGKKAGWMKSSEILTDNYDVYDPQMGSIESRKKIFYGITGFLKKNISSIDSDYDALASILSNYSSPLNNQDRKKVRQLMANISYNATEIGKWFRNIVGGR